MTLSTSISAVALVPLLLLAVSIEGNDYDRRADVLRNYTAKTKATLENASLFLMGQGNNSFEKVISAALGPYNEAVVSVNVYTQLFFVYSVRSQDELRDYRLAVLGELQDLLGFAAQFASRFNQPIGSVDCGLLPGAVLHTNIAPSLSEQFKALSNSLDDVKADVTNGRYNGSVRSLDGNRALRKQCEGINIEIILKDLVKLIAPGCERHSHAGPDAGTHSVADMVSEELKMYAKQENFPGGDENQCLPMFIARFTNSPGAVNVFRKSLDKYVFLAVTLEGLCTPFQDNTLVNIMRNRDRTKYVLRKLRKGLRPVDKIELNGTETWDCSQKGKMSTRVSPSPSDTTTSTPSAVSRSETEIPNGSSKFTTLAATSETPQTTASAPSGKSIKEAVKKVVIGLSDGGTLETTAWVKRPPRNQAIADKTTAALRDTFKEFAAYGSISVVLYLPYGKDETEQQCIEPDDADSSARDYNYEGTNIVVKFNARPANESLLKKTFGIVKNSDLVEDIFSSSAGDLCQRVNEALKHFSDKHKQLQLLGGRGFSGLAAVKCGRHFVWYQLAYRYFAAAGSSSPYVLTTTNEGKYSAKCGQLIFFL